MPLWTIAIETIATAGSVALLRDADLIAAAPLPPESRSARTLAAAIRNIWQTADKPKISLVGVAQGPGSFTGLRVGITTAKALAYAWQASLIGVNSLDVVADQSQALNAEVNELEVVLDAQRQELFVARFASLQKEEVNSGKPWQRLAEDFIVSVQDWLTRLTPQKQVAGPALFKLRSRLAETIPVTLEDAWQPRAETVGRLARSAHLAGAGNDLWTLVPHYGRPSYAEESPATKPR